MTDVTDIKSGIWGVSRIVQEADGGYATAAILQSPSLGDVQCFYPPFRDDRTGYVIPWAIVRFPNGLNGTPDADTKVLANTPITGTLGDLTTAQRNALRDFLENNLASYSFTDWDGSLQSLNQFSGATFSASTPLADVVRLLFKYMGHSAYRPRPAVFESHNTEYTDNFSTDPTSRWTLESGSRAWDSGNSEYDLNSTVDLAIRYSANDPGSIEQEAQITNIVNTTYRCPGAATRFDNTGVNDWYTLYTDAGGTTLQLARWNASVRTFLATMTSGGTWATSDWQTTRLAAEGGNGSNVVLSAWWVDHGSTKPSDPGWYGTDGSPQGTYTDTAASRLDDATIHLQCGVGTRTTPNYDTRTSFFKERAISDRGGGASITGPLIGAGHLIWGNTLVGGRLTQ